MKYRYSVTDNQSDLIIGYCNKIDGLTGKIVERDSEFYHKIVLYDFIFSDEYKWYLKKNKQKFAGLIHINMYDDNMKVICYFSFSNDTNIRHSEFYEFKAHINLELVGCLNEIPSKNELKLWEKWIYNFPKQKNQWIDLDINGRRDWLRMIRICHCCGYKEVNENTNRVFHLDGSNITTYDSFFIAFAEALNGPGTYFGSSLDGLNDCLCGGFGVAPPFKVIWENSSVAVKHLNELEWKRHRLYLKKYFKKNLDSDAGVDITLNLNIFHSIIDILLSRGVEVVLIP